MDPWQPTISPERGPAARPQRRAVLVLAIILVFTFGWLGWRLVLTVLPGSGDGTLLEDTTAFLDIWSTAPEVSEALAVLTEPGASHVSFSRTGIIAAHSREIRDLYTTSSKRPAHWWWPAVVGRLELPGGVLPIRRTADGLSVPLKSDTERLAWVPSFTEYGFELDCVQGNCPLASYTSVLQEHLSKTAGIGVHQAGEDLLLHTDSSENAPNLVSLTKRLAGESNPEVVTRVTGDGNSVQEQRPASEIALYPVSQSGYANILATSELENAWYIATIGSHTLTSSSVELLTQAVSELSTSAWTNTICGQSTSVYVRLHDTDLTSAYSGAISQGNRGLRLCTQNS